MPLNTLSQVEAEERLHYWQGVLRMQDWRIRLDIVRGSEMDEAYGRITKSDMRDARILLMDAIDVPSESRTNVNTDMEVTLVHELLHARFHDIGSPEQDTAEWRNMEAAIEATAQALVALDRKFHLRLETTI